VRLHTQLGDGSGGYMVDHAGVHHLSVVAAESCDVNEDAFGVVEVYHDKLRVEMVGALPDATRLQRWPVRDLSLPSGGQLVAGGGNDAGFAGILALCFYVFGMIGRAVLLPLKPVLRLASSPTEVTMPGGTAGTGDALGRAQQGRSGDPGADTGQDAADPTHPAEGVTRQGGTPSTEDPGVLV
jgi:hypothetical protein